MTVKPIVFILADALRSDYPKIHEMAVVQQLRNSQGAVVTVEPSTGFCEIIEYLTGNTAEQHGLPCQVTVKKDWQAAYTSRYLYILDKLLRLTRPIPKVRGLMNIIVDRVLKARLEPEIFRVRYNIPLHLLPFLTPTESKTAYDDLSFGNGVNILHDIRKTGKKIDLEGFVEFNKIKGTDDSRVEDLKAKISQQSLADFTMVYLGYCEMAHFWGTTSERLTRLLKSFDSKIEKIYTSLQENYDSFDFVIVGDHGMVDVTEYVDIQKTFFDVTKKFGMKAGRDIVYFIDSTMFRIWFADHVELTFREEIQKVLEKALNDKLDHKSEYLQNFKPEYGDLIFLLKPGKVFYPDFFSNNKNLGMHGYDGAHLQQLGSYYHMNESGNAVSDGRPIKLSETRDFLAKMIE